MEAILRDLAPATDCERGMLDQEVALLEQRGWLRACLPIRWGGKGWGTEPKGTRAAFEALRTLGRANLSVARLFEGHMNAVKLVGLYGGEPIQRDLAEAIGRGELLGVWGADDPDNPLRCEFQGERLVLEGRKKFASGLGLVSQAIVTTTAEDGPQMILAPTCAADRADQSAWSMGGMRATQSGLYDFSGVEIAASALLGEPGDYLREPYFEGGVWRYCAAHLGAAEALYTEMLAQLIERSRADNASQQRRIVAAAIAIESTRLWLTRASKEVEEAGARPDKAAVSLLARDVTEDACRLVAETVERALGMAAHIEGSFIQRMMRDLRLFLCQAAPDAKRSRAAATLVDHMARPEQL